jgi:hypothetical protein
VHPATRSPAVPAALPPQVTCLDDACPHRGAPLSQGWLSQDKGSSTTCLVRAPVRSALQNLGGPWVLMRGCVPAGRTSRRTPPMHPSPNRPAASSHDAANGLSPPPPQRSAPTMAGPSTAPAAFATCPARTAARGRSARCSAATRWEGAAVLGRPADAGLPGSRPASSPVCRARMLLLRRCIRHRPQPRSSAQPHPGALPRPLTTTPQGRGARRLCVAVLRQPPHAVGGAPAHPLHARARGGVGAWGVGLAPPLLCSRRLPLPFVAPRPACCSAFPLLSTWFHRPQQ